MQEQTAPRAHPALTPGLILTPEAPAGPAPRAGEPSFGLFCPAARVSWALSTAVNRSLFIPLSSR